MGVSYWGRTYEEGKKIGWKDGFRAMYCLIKYSLKRQSSSQAGQPSTCCLHPLNQPVPFPSASQRQRIGANPQDPRQLDSTAVAIERPRPQ